MKPASFALASSIILIAMISCVSGADAAAGVDWPQFHGPSGNNTTSEAGWRNAWSAEGPTVAWRAKAGMGMSSFAVVNGRVFTTGNDGDNQDTVWCFELASGKVLWRHDYPCKSPAHVIPIVPGGPSATPCVGEGRVYTVSREGDVFCLETATGEVLWQKSLVRDFGGKRPVYGYAGSPLLWQGRLFLDVGGEEGSTLCLDAATGQTLWATGAGEAGYSTPVITTLGGQTRIVLFKGRELVLLDPTDGSAIASYATTTTDFCNCATPAIGADGTIFISHTGNDGSTGLRLVGATLDAAWNVGDLGLLYNSGVPWGRNALMVFNDSKRGVNDLRCLDLSSGNVLWESSDVGKGTAILSAAHLIVLSTSGELQLCLPSDTGIRVLARAQVLDGKCWVLPALSRQHLLCRSNAGEVVCLRIDE